MSTSGKGRAGADLKRRQSAGVQCEVLQTFQQLEQQAGLRRLHELKLAQQGVLSAEVPLDGGVGMGQHQQQVAHLLQQVRDHVQGLGTPLG